MKKLSFAAGVLTMALIGGLGFSALAATGQVSFNISALSLNGTQVSAKGENYTLANGQSVPASITYTDEKGGGTTYLPVRRISELLDVETGWDGAAGAVTVKGEVKAPSTPETPKTDYSTWTAEEEKAYQEFRGLWTVTKDNAGLKAKYSGEETWSNFVGLWNGWVKTTPALYQDFFCQLAAENKPSDSAGISLWVYYEDKYLTQAAIYSSGNSHCYIDEISN